jgi:hypothetical protein
MARPDMETTEPKVPVAWQPLTPAGVAAFAGATLGRLFLVQFIVALMAAGAILWFLGSGWFPVIATAVDRLPDDAVIRSGRLNWSGVSPHILAENRFLAVVIDPPHSGQARVPADLQVEFGWTDVRFSSFLGYLNMNYPRGWAVALGRAEARPWWGAWSPPILALVAGAVVAWLMFIWLVLATLYAMPVWLAGFFMNRHLSLGGSWRLASAALMPGAVLMVIAILMYRLGWLDPVRVLVAAALHLVVGWIYLILSPVFLPRHPEVAGVARNPFDTSPRQPSSGSQAE